MSSKIYFEVTFARVEKSGEPKVETHQLLSPLYGDALMAAKIIVGKHWGVIKSFRRIEEFDITKL